MMNSEIHSVSLDWGNWSRCLQLALAMLIIQCKQVDPCCELTFLGPPCCTIMENESLSMSALPPAPVTAPTLPQSSSLSTPDVVTTHPSLLAAPAVVNPQPLSPPSLEVAASQPLVALAVVATPQHDVSLPPSGPVPCPSPSSSRSIQASHALPHQQSLESSSKKLDWGSIDEEDGTYAFSSLKAVSPGSVSAKGSGGAIDGCAGLLSSLMAGPEANDHAVKILSRS
jgi:hypothetical protein